MKKWYENTIFSLYKTYFPRYSAIKVTGAVVKYELEFMLFKFGVLKYIDLFDKFTSS